MHKIKTVIYDRARHKFQFVLHIPSNKKLRKRNLEFQYENEDKAKKFVDKLAKLPGEGSNSNRIEIQNQNRSVFDIQENMNKKI